MADLDVARLQEHIKSEDGFFEEEPEGWFAFGWTGQYPGTVIQRQTRGDLDICEIIRKHIKPRDVCQVQVSGSEKLRCIGGELLWISSEGSCISR